MLNKEKLIDYLHHRNLLFDSEIDDSPDSRTYYESTAKRHECWDLIKVIQSGKFDMKDKKCTWKKVSDDDGDHVYDISCNTASYYFEEYDREQGFKFCPYCGSKIDVKGVQTVS